MRKRISLYIIGSVLAIGAFLLYCYFTDASFLGGKGPPPLHVAIDPNRGIQIEQRSKTGELIYLFKAQTATPGKDPQTKQVIPGQYDLTELQATYYLAEGRIAQIFADTGTVNIDPAKGKKPTVFGGRLSGNVKIVISPADVPIDLKAGPKTGQTLIALEKDVEMSVTDGQLRSPGRVHVESEDIAFDGGGLTAAFSNAVAGNKAKKRIEYLRIDPLDPEGIKENVIIIHHVGQGNTSFLGGMNGSQTGPATKPAVTQPLAATAPTTLPAKADGYKLSFGSNVTATLTAKQGNSTLTSDRLFVLFMANLEKSAPLLKPGSETEPAATPAKTAKTAPATGPASDLGDLRVTWTGPMEMRPLDSDDLQLTDDKDRALIAEGTATRPVVVKEANIVIEAGTLWYHKFEDRVELEPGLYGSVHVTDPAQGKLTCQKVSFFQGKNNILLAGPGTMEVPQKNMHPDAPADAPPLVIAWRKLIDVDLLAVADARNTDKRDIRHALLTGEVQVKDPGFAKNPGFEMAANTLDLLMAKNPPGKKGQVLEHLVATDHVQIKAARPNAALADKPQGLTADRLEVLTTPLSGTLVPSQILATGNVAAWTYNNQSDFDEDAKTDVKPGAKPGEKHLVKQTLFTPTLNVLLEPREKNSNAADLASDSAVKSLTASDGVKVELEGFQTAGADQTVIATAQTMLADPRSGKATLQGDSGLNQPNAVPKPVVVTMGDNRITGEQILLDQKARQVAGNHIIEIPGPGTFTLIQPSKVQGEKGTPIDITWKQKMTFDQSNLARFFGLVTVKSVGKTAQTLDMTCNELLEVQLAELATAAPGAKKLQLSRLIARGDVHLTDTQFADADQSKMLTRMYTRTPEVRWSESDKMLELPSHGNILIEDYRDKPKGAKPDAQDSSGTTAFVWKGNLKFATDTGVMTMTGDGKTEDGVHVAYVPLTPIRMETTSNAAAKPIKRMDLYGDTLVTHLMQKKEEPGASAPKPDALPMTLGAGGKQSIESAQLDGRARADSGDTEITADTLLFDAVKNTITATAKNRDPAHFVGPEQNVYADELLWDRTKDHMDVQIIRPHGVFQPGN